ncbi:MAG TPA: metal ABC transporter ATP-binding protein [Candidatus Bathyarchaeia archaeon]|nr:metal ABC transporter ATP-binding protein [Candidatus Bathyarchaeia archaeon]
MNVGEDYVLKVSDLRVKLQNQMIIDNVSFRLRRGLTLALVGPNGAGKTMLLRALVNLVPFSGTIEWGLKVKIGYVPQLLSVREVPISVREFLSLKDGSKVEVSLKSVGLNKGIMDKSLGFLSGGELRRVLIAWAVIDEPDIMLLDEPTTGVDPGAEEAIYGMLKRLTKEKGITLILVSHDIHIIREFSDYILAMDKCMVFFGESKEIMRPEVQRAIYGEEHVCMYVAAEGK